MSNKIEQQIEDAFSYRGNVTITFKNGEQEVGFLYNREFPNPKLKVDPFIEIFPTGGGQEKYALSEIKSVELTGKDCADHESFEEWKKKQEEKKRSKMKGNGKTL